MCLINFRVSKIIVNILMFLSRSADIPVRHIAKGDEKLLFVDKV